MFIKTAFRNQLTRHLPMLPQRITRYTPAPVMEFILTHAVNQLLQQECAQGELNFLNRRIASVTVTDMEFSFSMTLNNNRVQIMVPAQAAEVTLRADQEALLQMLHNEADPDTLFFRRRLLITGDTELGLYLKNLIDSISLRERIPAPLMRLLTCIHLQRTPSIKSD